MTSGSAITGSTQTTVRLDHACVRTGELFVERELRKLEKRVREAAA